MAEDDLLQQELDHTETEEFPPPKRRIITQPQDLSVATLVEQWAEGMIFLPPIQREYVWDDGKASRLVESLLLNIPIPVVYFQETPDARFEVIDGHQRVNSLSRFLDNKFYLRGLRILNEYKGKRFHHLPEREQRFLKSRTLRAIIISQESHPAMKIEVFGRLNTGGIALNPQEVRNALFQGSLNDLLKELERFATFRQCLGNPVPRRRMHDRELVLRFLALHDRLLDYRPSLLSFLNAYMDECKHDPPEEIARKRNLFVATVEMAYAALGRSAFRVLGESGEPVERGINRALFDAQMLAFSWVVNPDVVPGARGRLLGNLAALMADETFRDSIRLATGDRTKTWLRVRLMVHAFQTAGLQIETPLMFE